MSMTEDRDCCSLPIYDNPSVCADCYTVDGVTIIKSNKGTGMGIFSARMAVKMGRHLPKDGYT